MTPSHEQKARIWRLDYRVQLHQDTLKKAIKKAQEATKKAEGGVYVSIG